MIEFFNVRSGERKEVETPEMIAAFYNSTDQHVNARVGQDMGWRIGPKTIERMNDIRRSQTTLDRIAQAFSLPQGEVADTDIINWISLEDERKKHNDQAQDEQDYQLQYEQELAKLNDKYAAKKAAKAKKAEAKKATDDDASGKIESQTESQGE